MAQLIWDDRALSDVVDVLSTINPKGHTAAHIKSIVERWFHEDGLRSYGGTAGWYVTIYHVTGEPEDRWRALPTLMAYTVKKYIELQTGNPRR